MQRARVPSPEWPRWAGLNVSLPTDNAARKRLQAWTYLTEYFPDSFLAEVEVAIAGNEQHNGDEPLHWAREKSTDQMNTAFRHMLDHKLGTKKDTDGQWHLAKAIWRLKAELQLTIEEERSEQGRPATLDEIRAEVEFWRDEDTRECGLLMPGDLNISEDEEQLSPEEAFFESISDVLSEWGQEWGY
jgi:hypothetical protein